jgi:hypothetical protein
MPKKFQSDDDDLMEMFQQHYAELRREHSEYEDTVHKLECAVAGRNFTPSQATLPRSAGEIPATVRTSVDLPAPWRRAMR